MITAQGEPVGRSLGIPAAAIVLAVSWRNVANGAGRVFWGWLSDFVGREMAMFIPFTLQAIFLIGVVTVGRLSGAWFIVSIILVYVTWGSMFSLFPAIIGDYFGADNATSNYGFLYTAKGVASIGGGGLAALLYEKFGNWNVSVYSTAALALLSGVLILVVRSRPLPATRQDETATSVGLAEAG